MPSYVTDCFVFVCTASPNYLTYSDEYFFIYSLSLTTLIGIRVAEATHFEKPPVMNGIIKLSQDNF